MFRITGHLAGTLVAILFVCLSTRTLSAAAEPRQPFADLILALPGDLEWQINLSDADRVALKELLAITKEQVRVLLQSDDGYAVGAAIFSAHSNGNLGLLWEFRHHVDDRRATIPRTVLGDTSGVSRPRQEQSVGSYLSEVLGIWLGRGPVSRRDLERKFSSIESPWQLVQPWVVRLRFAHEERSGETPTEVQRQIRELPAELRWAVVTWSYSDGYFTRAEARQALGATPESLEQARSGTLSVPTDPIISDTNSYKLDKLRQTYLELVTAPSEK